MNADERGAKEKISVIRVYPRSIGFGFCSWRAVAAR